MVAMTQVEEEEKEKAGRLGPDGKDAQPNV
jgi:hypothetical protein